MRLQYRLIQEGEECGLSGAAFRYFQMELERINALLYRADGQNRKSAESYKEACRLAKACFDALQRDTALEIKQTLFVGWACQEVWSEAIREFDAVMDYEGVRSGYMNAISVLKWLEPYMKQEPGLQTKAADLYRLSGGYFCVNGDTATGYTCFETSIRMFEEVDRNYGNNHLCYARSLWIRALYGLQVLLHSGDTKVMLDCEASCEKALAGMLTEKYEIVFAEAAMALIAVQKSEIFQTEDKLAEAISFSRQGTELFQNVFKAVEQEANAKNAYLRSVMADLTANIYATYIGAVETLGLQLYTSDQYDEAKQTLQQALTLLADSSKYKVSELASGVIRAESLMYLAMISVQEEDDNAVEFYAEQSVSQASELAKHIENEQVLRIESLMCSILAEYSLQGKNKQKALTYAEKGLEACRSWQRLDPQSDEARQITALLEKHKKKASRSFFGLF